MKLSEYIKELELLKEKHGDLEVQTFFLNGSYQVAPAPKAKHLRKLEGRQTKVSDWNTWDKPELKGELIVTV